MSMPWFPEDGCVVMFAGRFTVFKLAFPGVVIAADKRSATWDDGGLRRVSFTIPECLLHLRMTFGAKRRHQ